MTWNKKKSPNSFRFRRTISSIHTKTDNSVNPRKRKKEANLERAVEIKKGILLNCREIVPSQKPYHLYRRDWLFQIRPHYAPETRTLSSSFKSLPRWARMAFRRLFLLEIDVVMRAKSLRRRNWRCLNGSHQVIRGRTSLLLSMLLRIDRLFHPRAQAPAVA